MDSSDTATVVPPPEPDDDGDGVPNSEDRFPQDPTRTAPLRPLFPTVDGVTDFPDHRTGDQLEWIMAQIQGTSTSAAEIEARFTFGEVGELQDFFDTVRSTVPNAQVIEPLTVTANDATVVIGDPAQPDGPAGIVQLRTRATDGRITTFGVQEFLQNPTSVGPIDQDIPLATVAERLAAVADEISLLVAQIDADHRCVPALEANAATVRPIGSIFKTWVLGALAEGVAAGTLQLNDPIALDANEIAPGAPVLADEPLGTQLSVRDLATMMMGTSDNTATDHLHEHVGRDRLEAALATYGHANPSGLTPFLSINEQFHLYWTVSPSQAAAWIASDDAAQRTFLTDVIEPLGPVTAFPQANAQTLVDGSWSASALDVCRAIATMRQYLDISDAFRLVDEAYGANAGVWGPRQRWERVWFKGGSLSDNQGLVVLTGGWLVESDDRGAFVVVGMAETDPASLSRIHANAFFSLMARTLEIVDESNPSSG